MLRPKIICQKVSPFDVYFANSNIAKVSLYVNSFLIEITKKDEAKTSSNQNTNLEKFLMMFFYTFRQITLMNLTFRGDKLFRLFRHYAKPVLFEVRTKGYEKCQSFFGL